MMPNDDGYAREVIRVVEDLTRRLDEYTQAGDAAREALKLSVEGTVVAMRQDVHKALGGFQLNASQHKDEHSADRVERSNRQLIVNLWMAAVTALCLVSMGLTIYLVARSS